MIAGPAAVLWDMDGTLVDSEKVWEVALRDVARGLGGTLSAAARTAVVGSSMQYTLRVLFDDLGLAPDRRRMAGVGKRILARTGELFDGGLEWRPGAQAALAAVRSAGWPMALVTNTGRELTERALDVIGRHHFAATVCAEEVGRSKPDPGPYLAAARLLGVPAEHCLAVEDSPTGVLAAERAGAAVLVVPCETAVPSGPGRVERDTLVGLTADDVRLAYGARRLDRVP